ncbi:Uncharacterised protein [Yersinia rohdei]|uniref:Uncharacterized protein n=1 Tax=Yersinia rohdei TaxID=29485 RepID=A0A0U1HQU4_YERRO|nr:hypothetical protein [Yersinia rohdei]CNJ55995.1 Uncharacterised protein [Yersinia rohdei]CQI88951.1 Uncharacterised protein [Yersinia rohdei]
MSENTDYETLKAEYIELDKKYGAVAAENILLKTASRDMLKNIRKSGGESEIYGIGWDRLQDAVESALNIPATTQAINEIKAQGVDKFADNWQGNESHSQISEMARQFAASLRGGE